MKLDRKPVHFVFRIDYEAEQPVVAGETALLHASAEPIEIPERIGNDPTYLVQLFGRQVAGVHAREFTGTVAKRTL